MEKIKKLMLVIIIVAMFFHGSYSVFSNISYADEEDNTSSESGTTESSNEGQGNSDSGGTTENSNTSDTSVDNNANSNTGASTESQSSSGTGTGTTTTTKKTTTTKSTSTAKSSNANLSDLGIKPNDFTGFKPGITSYNVEVENSVTSIEIYAKTQDSKAKATGGGKKNLEEGNNSFNIIVTAENGTKKTYTINVTRKASTEAQEETTEETNTEEENQNETLGLSKLVIEGVELSPEFKPDVFEYSAKYIGEKSSLNIEATASKESSIVEIIGNEDLKDGENLINILVTDSEGNIYTYQVTLKKSLVDEEALENQRKEEQRKKDRLTAIYIAIGAIIILLIIIIIVSHKVHNNKEIKKEEENEIDKLPKIEDEEAEKVAYVNSILQTNLEQKEEPEPYVQDAWFKKEQMKEEQEERDYEGPIIYEPEDNYDYNYKVEEVKETKHKKKKSKGKRFK